ncbi:hypothetical protein [Microtetraspora malaysiensis]|uniref:Uncharacterized protein n=1 Tax=Microtetraspora malaysiensis TaxID=161358 RepID=A0ABW6SSS9_9ACTN
MPSTLRARFHEPAARCKTSQLVEPSVVVTNRPASGNNALMCVPVDKGADERPAGTAPVPVLAISPRWMGKYPARPYLVAG